MAITTNTGAKKIEGTENWRNIFDIHNDTVDAYDALAEQKDEETGIVVRGNKTTHADGAAAGQFVILRNSTITGCADGLYTAAKAIPYNTAIDSTYLTACPEGGLNALNSKIANLIKIINLPNVTTSADKGLVSVTSYVPSDYVIIGAYQDGFYNIVYRHGNSGWTIGVYDFDWQTPVKNTSVGGIHLVCYKVAI